MGAEKKGLRAIFFHIENLFREYSISTAAYRGRKLNGVDCNELSTLQNQCVFILELTYFLWPMCSDICVMLGYLASKLG